MHAEYCQGLMRAYIKKEGIEEHNFCKTKKPLGVHNYYIKRILSKILIL